MGTLVFLILTLPWFWISEIRNPGFLKYFFLNENLMRFISPDYGDRYGWGHVEPYGAALVMLLITALPWTAWCAVLLLRKESWRRLISSFKDERTSMFTFGLLGITGFLCCFRQIILTYLLPVLPFFAIWFAILLQKSGITRKTIIHVSVATVFIYGIAYPLTRSWTEHRYSAKGIIQLSRDARAKFSLDGGLLFVGKVPLSAYFYGDKLILPHADENAGLSISRGLNSGKGNLYVIKKEYQADVPPLLRDKLKLISVFGDWTLYRAAE
jgi:hypothetical protein